MSDQNRREMHSIPCPYCTRNLPIDAKHCPWCGTSYGSETIRFLRSVVQDVLAGDVDERREYARIPKNFQVSYDVPEGVVTTYLSNISLGGVFIKTELPLEKGTHFSLRIELPDGGKELDIDCEVVWARFHAITTPKGKAPVGMGVKFLHISSEDRERIRSLLVQVKPST